MPVGEPGGPDTEMFYDFYPELGRACIAGTPWSGEFCHVNCDCGRFIEIGNNVFMEYIKTESGYSKLSQQNVDFGGGLERIVAAVRNDADVFNIDVFDTPKETILKLSGKKYEDDNVYAYRVILDHLRAATFLVGDGVMPGNKDQMYFVRRLIRRAVRFARNLGIETNFTKEVVESYIKVYSSEYKNLSESSVQIINAIDIEESKFRKTLEKGIRILNNAGFVSNTNFAQINPFENMSENEIELVISREQGITGDWLFNFYQESGFPFELAIEELKSMNLIYGKEHLEYLTKGFQESNKKHKEESRTAAAGKFKGGLGGDGQMEVRYHTATHMLHQALKTVLGESVEQKGSNITAERLRFDFAFDRKMTDDEKKKVEDIVNENIQKKLQMIREEVTFDEAVARGAIGLFGDKYGETVSIYYMAESGNKRGDTGVFSIEFCGGPHVQNSSELGVFKISKEEAVSAGVRRIKAVLS